ncbi:MAG: redoxin domain-containing protein [Rhizobacter sp.]
MSSRRHVVVAGVAVAASLAVHVAHGAPPAPPAPAAVPGRPAPPFEVADTAGRTRTLAEFKGRIVVLEWTSPSCPYAAAQYKSGRMPALQRWATQKGVVWLTVLSSHPTREDWRAPAAADTFNRQRGGVPSALLIDASGSMGHAYGAATADHMFVIASDGTLVYAGGIDDSDSMDPKEVTAAHNHVRAALDDLVAGRRVAKPATEPFGCALAYAG